MDSKTKKAPQDLQTILAKLSQVDFGQIEAASKVINEVQEDVARASKLADALVEDHETLLVEVDVNRELLKEILGPVFDDAVVDARERVLRARALAKNKNPEGQ